MKRCLLSVLMLLALVMPAIPQQVGPGGLQLPVNKQTGTTYTISSGDLGKLITFNNLSAVSVTMVQAIPATGLAAGWFCEVQNIGNGLVTLTPTISTINRLASITLSPGQGMTISTDGANYFAQEGGGNLPIFNVSSFLGTDAGAQISACITALPATGGTCSALGLQGAQTSVGNIVIGSSTKPVTVLLGPGLTLTMTSPSQITLDKQCQLIGSGPSTLIKGNHTTAIIAPISGTSGWRISNLVVDNTSNTNVGGILIQDGGGGADKMIQNVGMSNAETGIFLAGSTYTTIYEPSSGATVKTAISIGNSGASSNSNTIYGGVLNGATLAIDINGTGNAILGLNCESSTTCVRVGNFSSQPSANNLIIIRFVQGNTTDVNLATGGGGNNANTVICSGCTITDNGASSVILSTNKTYNSSLAGVGDKEWVTVQSGATGLVAIDNSQASGSRQWGMYNSGGNLSIRTFDGTSACNATAGCLLFDRATGAATFISILFAALPASVNGTTIYCSNCLKGSNPCSGASTGTFADRINGAWVCR